MSLLARQQKEFWRAISIDTCSTTLAIHLSHKTHAQPPLISHRQQAWRQPQKHPQAAAPTPRPVAGPGAIPSRTRCWQGGEVREMCTCILSDGPIESIESIESIDRCTRRRFAPNFRSILKSIPSIHRTQTQTMAVCSSPSASPSSPPPPCGPGAVRVIDDRDRDRRVVDG